MNWLSQKILPKIKALVTSDEQPENLWMKCTACNQMIFHQDFAAHFNTCESCGHHMPLSPEMRMALLFDDGTAEKITLPEPTDDPLHFRDLKRYKDRLKSTRQKLDTSDALQVSSGLIGGNAAVVAAFDFRFMGGSMGRAVGDGILQAANTAVERHASLIIVPSTGGARMQEGILSLMQLPRTIIAIDRVKAAGLAYLVLLSHPTTGGVTASFAMLGDIHLAEPGAVIGFAGRRVIEETVREQLPADFQTAEYLEAHGVVDMVVPRARQREVIGRILSLLHGGKARLAG